jgi:lipopolysaccharide export system protein LptA
MKNSIAILFKTSSAIFCLALLSAAHAEKADLNKPTNVEANQMFYDESKYNHLYLKAFLKYPLTFG